MIHQSNYVFRNYVRYVEYSRIQVIEPDHHNTFTTYRYFRTTNTYDSTIYYQLDTYP